MKNSLRAEVERAFPAYLTVFAISIFFNLLVLVPPIYLMQVHGRVFASRNLLTLGFLTAIAVTLLVAWAVLAWARSEICSRAAFGLMSRIEDRVFRASQKLGSGIAGSARYVADLQSIRDTMGGSFVPALCDVALSPIFIIVLFLLHPAFGFLGIGLTALLAGLSFLNLRLSREPNRQSQEAQAASLEFSGHLARNTEAARAMGMVPGLARLWKERQQASRGWQAAASRRTAPILSVVRLIRSSQLIIVIFVGAILYINGLISAGSSFAAVILLTRSIGPIETVITGWRGFTQSRDAFARLETLLAEDDMASERVSLPRPRGDLAVSHLSLASPDTRQPIVRDVSFEVEAGKVIAIIGPSGAGKSTLLRALANVWAPASGNVTLDGHAYHQWNPDELGQLIGYLPQDTELLPGTAAQNISRFYPDRPDEDAELFEAITLAGIDDLIKNLPQGLNTLLGPKGHQLSGGQRQRIALARAIYGRPPLILLDEPYSALDSKAEAHLVSTLSTLARQGSTVVLVTHKLNMLGSCDYVLVMQSGFLQAFGARDVILQRLPQTPTPLRVVGNS